MMRARSLGMPVALTVISNLALPHPAGAPITGIAKIELLRNCSC